MVNQSLDTLGGSGKSSYQVLLGQAKFTSDEDLIVWTSKPNGTADGNNSNDSIKHSYGVSLSGSYKVGYRGAPIRNLSTGLTILENTWVCGPVKFFIRKNPYNIQPVFKEIKGTSRKNTVEFISQHVDSVIFRSNARTAAEVHNMIFDGTEWISFKNITIEGRDTVKGVGVNFRNGASHIGFSNCVLKLDSTDRSKKEDIFGMTFESGKDNQPNDIHFDSCKFIGGLNNVKVIRADSQYHASNVRFTHTEFYGAEQASLYIQGIDSLLIENCIIGETRDSLSGSAAGLSYISNFQITKNFFEGQLSLSGTNNSKYYNGTARSLVANNIISKSKKFANALQLNALRETNILHNSIIGDGYSLVVAKYVRNVSVINNIFSFEGKGRCFITGDQAKWDRMDYNNFHLSHPKAVPFYYEKFGSPNVSMMNVDSIQFINPSGYKSLSHQNNWSQDPNFLDTLAYVPSELFPILYGPNQGVNDDKLGKLRCKYFSAIGPYETDSAFSKVKARFFTLFDTVWFKAPTLFTNSSTGYISAKWYIDGVFLSDSAHLKYIPQTTNTFKLKLVVENCGGKDSITKSIKVYKALQAPRVNFYYDKSKLTINTPLTLKDSTKYGPTRWYYDIRDSLGQKVYFDKNLNKLTKLYTFDYGDSTSQFPIVSFKKKGIYYVKLRAENIYGMDSITKVIRIKSGYQMPEARFSVADTIVFTNEQILIKNQSLGKITHWSFDITNDKGGKGMYDPNILSWDRSYYFLNSDSLLKSPTVWFAHSGYYTIRLIVENPEGIDTFIRTSYIHVKLSATVCDFYDLTSGGYGILYDDGGARQNYSDNKTCDYKIITCQGMVKMTMNDFDLKNGDFLEVYDGQDDTGTPLWDKSTYAFGMTGTSKDPSLQNQMLSRSGSVYVRFSSDQNKVTIGRGFALSWEVDTVGFKAPKADFIYTDTVCADIQTMFRNKSSGSYHSLKWDLFNDSKIDHSGNIYRATIGNSGKVEVALIAQSYCWDNDTLIQTIEVTKPSTKPAPYFIIEDSLVTAGKTTRIFATRDRCVSKAEWTIFPSDYKIEQGSLTNSDTITVRFTHAGLYSVYLMQENAQGKKTFSRVNSIRVYCKPKVNFRQDKSSIEQVTFNTIDNKSSTGLLAYNDFSSKSTVVLRGRNYVLGVKKKASSDAIGRKAWVDWNMDGVFNDSLELVMNKPSNSSTLVSDTITIPVTAQFGETRMRVSSSKSGLQIPCGPTNYGEYEDYTIYIIGRDTVAPELALMGNRFDTVQVFETWKEPGFSAIDLVEGNLTSTVKKTGVVNSNKLGKYELIYTVSDIDNNTATIKRFVEVIDTITPTIRLNGSDSIYLLVGDIYIEQGASISDNYYNGLIPDIQGKVNTKAFGEYELKYCATDSSGNGPRCISRWITVDDKKAPTITLKGGSTYETEQCAPFVDPGYDADDNDTAMVTTTGTWQNDSDTKGTFELIYTVTDRAGNKNTVTRIIKVVDTTAARIKLRGSAVDTVKRWATYDDPGVKLTMFCKDSLETTVLKGGSYKDAQSVGVYSITYQAKDSSDNRSKRITRVVVVEMPDALEKKIKNDFIIYPNPSKGVLLIKSSEDIDVLTRLTIYNSNGQMVYNERFIQILTDQPKHVNLGDLSTGVYYLTIQNKKDQFISKLIITK